MKNEISFVEWENKKTGLVTVSDVRGFLEREAKKRDVPPKLWLDSFKRTNGHTFLRMSEQAFRERIVDQRLAALAFSVKEEFLRDEVSEEKTFFAWNEGHGESLPPAVQEIENQENQEEALRETLLSCDFGKFIGGPIVLTRHRLAVLREVASRAQQIMYQHKNGLVATNRSTTVVVVGRRHSGTTFFCRALVLAVSLVNKLNWAWVSYKEDARTILRFPPHEHEPLVFGVDELFALRSEPTDANTMAWTSAKAGMKRGGTIGIVTASDVSDFGSVPGFEALNGTVAHYFEVPLHEQNEVAQLLGKNALSDDVSTAAGGAQGDCKE